MGAAFRRGAAVGLVLGAVTALLVGFLVIGTDDIPDFARREDLPVLYVFAVVIGAVTGWVLGALCLLAAAWVARSSTSSPVVRRRLGALAAGGVAIIVSILAVSPLLVHGPLLMIAFGALAAGVAWWLLPGVVDLSGAPAPAPASAEVLPPWGSHEVPQADGAPMSTTRRVIITVGAAGAGSFILTMVVMSVLPLSRSVGDVLAFVVLGVLFLVLAATVWHRLGPRGAGRSPRP